MNKAPGPLSLPPGKVIRHGKLIYSEIRIQAPSPLVWKIFTAFDTYSSWNPFIRSLNGIPKVGEILNIFLQPNGEKGMTFRPRVLTVESGREFRWIGKLFLGGLFDGEHTFLLKDNKDGSTTFIQYERFRGILVPFLKNMLEKSTKPAFIEMNEALKKRCEAGNAEAGVVN